jgi:UDP-N-acetylmuramoyl-tripeptide--D-alanyl-D-alanine ligase
MTEPLWTLPALTAAMGARSAGAPAAQATGISIDSRTLQPGELFFAIKGDVHDGHAFVPAALKAGAAAAVVSQEHAAEFEGPLLAVPDVLEALVALGRAARARSGAKIVAVTGSVGKTGTKEALRVVLSPQGPTHASDKSFNNHWGVPLTLARLPLSAHFGVFEIGMNHAGEITPLVGMVRPHAAIVTAVEPVHIENLGSIEAIADAKSEIFSGLEPGGAAIINRDNPHYARVRAHAEARGGLRIVGFGEHPQAEIRLTGLELRPDDSLVRASVLGRPVAYRIGSPGRHVAMNSLAVLGAVAFIGADVDAAAAAFADVVPPAGRGSRLRLGLPGGEATLIDESYNANPASMRAALAILGRLPVTGRGRRVAVLGDMLELGEQGPALHAGLAEPVAANDIDIVHSCGPLMRNLHEALPPGRRGAWAASAAELQPLVLADIRPGDVVTVKGSNGSRTSAIVAALKAAFPMPADAA